MTSRKPTNRGPYQGTRPRPTLDQYASEAEITNTAQARREVNAFNQRVLQATQPYDRAAEMRAGTAFRRMQEAQIRAENVGAAPYRGFGSVALGKNRPLPDVGP